MRPLLLTKYHNLNPGVNKNFAKMPQEGQRMCREAMIQEIMERLSAAPNADVEAVYWMVLVELGEG